MKKLITLALAGCLLVSVLAACSNNPSTSTPKPESKPDDTSAVENNNADGNSFAGQTLKIAVFEGGYGPAYWETMVARFEEEYDVTVEMQISPSIGEIVMPQIVAGDVPDFLSINVNESSGLVASLIKEKGLLEITDFFEMSAADDDTPLKDRVLDGLLESTLLAPYGDGKIYLAPFNAGPNTIVYNKTLFEEKNWDLPETFDEFFALGDVAAEEGIALFTYASNAPGYVQSLIIPAIANNAGIEALQAIFAYEEGAFENEKVKEVLEAFAKIGQDGYLLNGTLAMNHTQTQNEVMLNHALFIPNGVWIEGEMSDAPRADGFEFAMTSAFVLNPNNPKYVLSSLEQFSIPAKAENPELAKEFLRFLYTEESIRLFAEQSGGVYALKGTIDVVKDYVTEGVYNMYQVYDEGLFLVNGWQAVPADAKVAPNTEFWNQVADIMNGTMTVDQWVAHMEGVTAEVRAAQ